MTGGLNEICLLTSPVSTFDCFNPSPFFLLYTQPWQKPYVWENDIKNNFTLSITPTFALSLILYLTPAVLSWRLQQQKGSDLASFPNPSQVESGR